MSTQIQVIQIESNILQYKLVLEQYPFPRISNIYFTRNLGEKGVKNKNLENRLMKYSLASAALLFGTESANAQVWGFDVNPDEVLDVNFETFDINFDSNHRFTFRYREQVGYRFVSIIDQTGSASWIRRPDGRAKALSSGYVISIGRSFAQTPDRFADRADPGGFISGSSFFNTDKYIGVKFKIGANTHYGWILVNVILTGQDLESITIKSYAYNQTPDQLITANGVLPVELTSFTASSSSNNVTLNWETATEVNNYGFNIERTETIETNSQNPDDIQWETIGFVQGYGNSNSPKQYEFIDARLFGENPAGENLQYRLKQIDTDGSYTYYSTIAEVDNSVTSIEDNKLSNDFSLSQNYPNPFNPVTNIEFSLPRKGFTTLRVYNTLGEEVAELVSSVLAEGKHTVSFNADNLPSGIYVYRLNLKSDFSKEKKMLVIK